MGNPEEAGVANTGVVDDAPPPYSEVGHSIPAATTSTATAAVNPGEPPAATSTTAPVPNNSKETVSSPSLSSSASNNAQPTTSTSTTNTTTTKFPPTLNAYYQKKITRTFHLGPTGSQPLFAVKVHTGMTRHPEVELFDGPSEKEHPLLATARHDGRNDGSATLITLPPLPGSTGSGFSTSSEIMRAEWGLGFGSGSGSSSSKNVMHRFSIEVGDLAAAVAGGVPARREDFEWRSTHGSEVQELTSWWSTGWKLVRLASRVEGANGGSGDGTSVVSGSGDAESSSSSSATQKQKQKQQRPAGVTSDGKEIVAVWALNTASLSMTKAFKFQFMGSGALGQLGERWEVMAVVTALRLWYLVWQGRAHAPSSGSLGR